MKKIGILLIFLLTFTNTTGQENSIWYSFGNEGDKTKIRELKDIILYEEVKEEESPYPARVDTLDIVKRIDASNYIIFKPNRQGDYALMTTDLIHDGAIKSIGIYYPSETAEQVEKLYTNNGLPLWKDLTKTWVFTEKKVLELENAPGYDEATREAVLEALSIRQGISPDLKAFQQEFPDTKSWQLYRFVEVKAQHKFIELGYNPYKRVVYNFEKQFAGDEEVIKALTEPMSFD
ncbi:hypothetical protein [Croceivirga thetidis]|uniref:DUF4476 domain-containing protein n=1 Tax=Croceivirga thetidis TaxID=2721623 RepID=A0ABX1GR39_9FLAO|nr:hypothetical protein [Croceivirga thetidis]NKI32393.1 hypothetical protein [Croceivirga thetidis]